MGKKNISAPVAIITGGTKGIGFAISEALANRGYSLILVYKKDDNAAELALNKLIMDNHILYKCDISIEDDVVRFEQFIKSRKIRIQLLVNNAGIAFHHPIDQVSFDTWVDSWKSILRINVLAVSNMSYIIARHMISLKIAGKIINISSRGGRRGEPLMPAYGASKAAINSLTQSLAKSLMTYKIFVGAIAPGFVETQMSKERLRGKIGEKIKQQSPLNRVASPDEIAQSVLTMLESPLWMTGNIFDVNGASYFR